MKTTTARAVTGGTLAGIGCVAVLIQLAVYAALIAGAVWVVKWAWIAF